AIEPAPESTPTLESPAAAVPAAAPDAPPVFGFEQPPAVESGPVEPPAAEPAAVGDVPSVPPVPPVVVTPAPRNRGGAVIALAALVAFVVAGFAGLAGGFLGARLADNGTAGGISSPTGRIKVLPSETDEPIVAASAAAVPSVVNIEVRSGTASGGESNLPTSHPTVPMTGNGSGVAFKSIEGGGTYIITNNHVVENAVSLTVRDADGRSMPAKVVGKDPETDIAVVSIQSELPTIEIGDSSKLIVGQTVVAIGSPFGLEHSVTSGVVSALGRSLPDFAGANDSSYPLVDVIQTDAAINPGNSGGALVDRSGKLVGINTAIYSDSGSSGGIGFAVPANTATRVANQLIGGTGITHPFLGIVGQTVTEELAAEEKLTVQEGAYVADITPGSGAAAVDIKKGDVVTTLDEQSIRSMDDLILQVRRHQVGDTITVGLVRGSEKLTVKVKIGDKPADLKLDSGETSPTPKK
ncbi:MAG TPA: trypsin-like peptidase domain-containing protein, partial [Coriobacteriia bacterium]|nr:trypsin-like peptidase domain-containing protein [Coriobacteriia bacterium]